MNRFSFFLRTFCFSAILFVVSSFSTLYAQNEVAKPNEDESKVPAYVLPETLVLNDGTPVQSAEQWVKQRRPELLDLFCANVYGYPILKSGSDSPLSITANVTDQVQVFDGKGTRHLVQVTIRPKDELSDKSLTVHLAVYTPCQSEKSQRYPVFLGLHFGPIHTISEDPSLPLLHTWQRKENRMMPSKESDRGSAKRRFPIETILERGYGLAVAYYYEIEPDFHGGKSHGVRSLLPASNEHPENEQGNTIATWAWGLSMLLDVLTDLQEPLHVDPTRVIVWGHSRLGKTSLWAGALDSRFAMVISNDSGCGGAALSRREFGETVHRINVSFPHWFCEQFKTYNQAVDRIPVDQHQLIALIAPRPVYVASASEDLWADPRGEFLAAFHADPVYRLLGTQGLGSCKDMPGINEPVGARIGYHLREGKHDILLYDWIQFMNFADRELPASISH